jgi:hypothetical protein
LKIGIKFCGGCNPSFDRVAAAGQLKNKFKDKAEFVSFTDPEAELILVFMGCSAACAEISGMDMEKVIIINSESDADSFML